jgi:chromate transporter
MEHQEVNEESVVIIESSLKEDNVKQAPSYSFPRLFMVFLWFGLRAWGGPVAQIQMIQQQLVIEEQWITQEKFNRVLAVYQVLPGPEATELCCYFGFLSRGRLGSIVAGLAFILPGFILMMIFSYIYTSSDALNSPQFKASFLALQPTVAAMVFRATHKISEHAFANPNTHQFDNWLFAIGCVAAAVTTIQVNFFITLLFCGLIYVCIHRREEGLYVIGAICLVACSIASLMIWIALKRLRSEEIATGSMSTSSTNGNNNNDNEHNVLYQIFGKKTLYAIFLLGLLAGLLTFGGAYTAIPFVQRYAVDEGKWLTTQQFMDGLAIGAVLPSPLVIFATFVGYVGGGFGGAILMTIGMFLPAFSFTIIGHSLFERLVENKSFSAFLDGITAGVVGLIAATAVELLRNAIELQPNAGIGGVIFGLALAALYHFKSKLTGPLVVLAAALAGQLLYVG